jgi:hypothetical protein
LFPEFTHQPHVEHQWAKQFFEQNALTVAETSVFIGIIHVYRTRTPLLHPSVSKLGQAGQQELVCFPPVAVVPTQPPVHWVPGVKQPRHKDHHLEQRLSIHRKFLQVSAVSFPPITQSEEICNDFSTTSHP